MRALLKWHEGLRNDLYLCTAGKCTIGVGHNLDAKGSREEIEFYKKNRASKEQIENWLTKDIQDVVTKLDKSLGKETWYQNLSPNRKMVLVDMGFNMGTDGVLKFDRTLELIKSSKFDEAAEQMLKSKWANQVGERAERLAQIIRTDTFPKVPSNFYR
jgi:lysozyme